MRKMLIALFTIGLLVGGSAFAQGMNLFGGVSFGLDTFAGATFFPATVHFGAENVGMQNLAVRADASYWINAAAVEFGVDGMYKYPVGSNISVYGGLGPRVLVSTAGFGTAFGVGVFGGAEYMVTSNIGVNGEVNVTPYFSGGAGTFFGFSVGANYYF